MNSGQVNIASITCQFSDLTAFTIDPEGIESETVETIFSLEQPFQIQVTVRFGGGGAIALMPLALPLQVEFFAKAYGSGTTIDLGQAMIKTTAKQFVYPISLEIGNGPTAAGLVAEKLYNISALLKVGTLEGPAFITGFTENLAIQIYNL